MLLKVMYLQPQSVAMKTLFQHLNKEENKGQTAKETRQKSFCTREIFILELGGQVIGDNRRRSCFPGMFHQEMCLFGMRNSEKGRL